MATNPLYYNPALNAVTGNASNTLNSATIQIYTGAQPTFPSTTLTGTLLATMTFGATAFPAASSGVATANAITSGTAGNTGTAGYFAVVNVSAALVATGTCGTSSADMILNTTSVVSGAPVSCSSFTITG